MATTEEIKLKIKLQTEQFKRNLSSLNSKVKKFSSVVSKETKKVQNSFKSTFANISSFAKSSGFLGILSGGALLAFTKHVAQNSKELKVWSQTLGIAEDKLAGVQFAFQEVGFGAEKTTDILKDVNDKVGDFLATGGGEAANIFKRLGLTRESVESRDAIGIIEAIQAKIEELNVPIKEQTFIWEALANDLSKASPLLKNNAELLKKLGKEAQGVLLGKEARENFTALDKNVRRLAQSYSAVGAKVLNVFLPGINAGIVALESFGNALNKLIDSVRFADLGKIIGGWLADLRESNLNKSGGNLGGAGFSSSDLSKPTQFQNQAAIDSVTLVGKMLVRKFEEPTQKLAQAAEKQIVAANTALTAAQKQTEIGKILGGGAKAEFQRIVGGAATPQAQSKDFDSLAQRLIKRLQSPLSTGGKGEVQASIRHLQEIAQYFRSRGGNVGGMELTIAEIKKFAKDRLNGKDKAPKAEMVIHVKKGKEFDAEIEKKVKDWQKEGLIVTFAEEASQVGK